MSGGLLDRKFVAMLLTDADGAYDSSERVLARAICRPCAAQIEELDRSRPLFNVLSHALLRERRERDTNGHPPPAPRFVVAVSQAAAKGYRISGGPAASADEVAAYLAGTLVHEPPVEDDAETEPSASADDEVEDDVETEPWDRMLLAALPALAAGERLGLPEWVIGSYDVKWCAGRSHDVEEDDTAD
jgi:hypothetical protein